MGKKGLIFFEVGVGSEVLISFLQNIMTLKFLFSWYIYHILPWILVIPVTVFSSPLSSLTRWTWVWENSRSWWWTGRPGVLWFTGSQRVGTRLGDWTELNWTEVDFVSWIQTVVSLHLNNCRILSYLSSLSFSFFICQTGIIFPSLKCPCVSWNSICKIWYMVVI